MKKLIIYVYRHADPNEAGTDITPVGKMLTQNVAELEGPFDMAFSADNGRCVATAMVLALVPEEKVVASKVFDDFRKGDNIVSRIAEIQAYVLARTVETIGYAQDVVKVAIVASSNLVSALKQFTLGRPIPADRDELPPVLHVAGTSIAILFG